MAVDAIRHRSRIVDIGFTKESRAGSLWALAGSVGEISNPFFVVDWHWEPLGMVTRSSGNESWSVLSDGGGQSALYAASNVCDSSAYSFSGSYASGACYNSVALRIDGGLFRLVRALAADFRSLATSEAITGRTRSPSIAQAGTYCRNAAAD